MNKINFTKMEGAGNDYVYINTFEEKIKDPSQLAIQMSHRHFGVGSDGLVLIAPSKKADLRMIMYNADGSRSEMCGNAIRCVGKYGWDHKLVSQQSLQVETDVGLKKLDLKLDEEKKVCAVSVSMGVPELDAQKIPSTLKGNMVVDQLFQFENFSLKGTLVSMGNPHFVTFVEDVKQIPVEKWGREVENSNYFPNRINIEFVQVLSRTEVTQRTWERGSGETWACGTGASAVCVAGVLSGRTERKILNHLTGGDLTLSWIKENDQLIMEGPAKEVFSGTWDLNTDR